MTCNPIGQVAQGYCEKMRTIPAEESAIVLINKERRLRPFRRQYNRTLDVCQR